MFRLPTPAVLKNRLQLPTPAENMQLNSRLRLHNPDNSYINVYEFVICC